MTLSSLAFLISALCICSNTLCSCIEEGEKKNDLVSSSVFDVNDYETTFPNVPVASHVKLLLVLVLLDALEDGSVRHTHGLDQSRQVLHVEMSVGTSVGLPGAGRVFRQDLLTAVGAVAAASAIRVAAHLPVCVAHIIPVFLVELVVGDLVKGTPPEHQALFEIQADALEE